jgi:hypothetical protein
MCLRGHFQRRERYSIPWSSAQTLNLKARDGLSFLNVSTTIFAHQYSPRHLRTAIQRFQSRHHHCWRVRHRRSDQLLRWSKPIPDLFITGRLMKAMIVEAFAEPSRPCYRERHQISARMTASYTRADRTTLYERAPRPSYPGLISAKVRLLRRLHVACSTHPGCRREHSIVPSDASAGIVQHGQDHQVCSQGVPNRSY